jgi:hypothetical protein
MWFGDLYFRIPSRRELFVMVVGVDFRIPSGRELFVAAVGVAALMGVLMLAYSALDLGNVLPKGSGGPMGWHFPAGFKRAR